MHTSKKKKNGKKKKKAIYQAGRNSLSRFFRKILPRRGGDFLKNPEGLTFTGCYELSNLLHFFIITVIINFLNKTIHIKKSKPPKMGAY